MQNLTDEIKDLLLTRSLLLQRVSNSLTKDIINAYVSVIDDILAQIATGKNINLVNMNKIINELNAKLSPDLTSVSDDLVQLGISEASYVANGINGAIGIDLVSKLPTDKTVQKIVNTSLMDGLTISEWLGKQDKAFQETLTKQIRLAVIEGETNPQIVSRLKSALDIKNNNNIKTIVRTAVSTITGQVREQTYKENEDIFKGWEWNATLDSRTRPEHAAYDGMAHDLNGKGINEKGKKYNFIKAPNGWNCRCISLPITKSFKELGIPLNEIPKGTRSSMDGYVSRDTTFEKWFEGKPKAFQEEYLGKSRYELYKKGAITFSDLVNQNGRVLKVSELAKISPITKVSNVPTIDFGYGGKFNKYVENIRDEAKIVIDKLPKPYEIKDKGLQKSSYYMPSKKLTDGKTGSLIAMSEHGQATFIHEYGHHIDYNIMPNSSNGVMLMQRSMNKDFLEARNLDIAHLKDKFKGKNMFEELSTKWKGQDDFNGASDIFDSMSLGVFYDKYGMQGHGSRYYNAKSGKGKANNKSNQQTEVFAQLFEAYSNGGRKWDNVLEHYPNQAKVFENVIKEFING